MNAIAFLTMDSLARFVSYDSLVADCLAARGVKVQNVSWRDPTVRWNDFELVVIRSPWDYQHAVEEFLEVLQVINSSEAVLWNSLDVVHWNIRKTYLQQLHDQGITIVPTQFVNGPNCSQIRSLFDVFQTDQIVIKPVVGAGAENTFWLRSDSSDAELQRIALLYASQTALLQPFIPGVIEHGETSLIFIDGQYSHSVLKTPKPGDFRVQEEHGSQLQAISVDPELIKFSENALKVAPHRTLYGRVDLVELPNGDPAVMELELIEPSLYLSYDADAAVRFADAIQLFGERQK